MNDNATWSRATCPRRPAHWWDVLSSMGHLVANNWRAIRVCKSECPIRQFCLDKTAANPPTWPCIRGGKVWLRGVPHEPRKR